MHAGLYRMHVLWCHCFNIYGFNFVCVQLAIVVSVCSANVCALL